MLRTIKRVLPGTFGECHVVHDTKMEDTTYYEDGYTIIPDTFGEPLIVDDVVEPYGEEYIPGTFGGRQLVQESYRDWSRRQ